MEVRWSTIIVRPELHAPEVDEYDEIHMKNVISGIVALWEKISYRF
jgi:hypothetical protein